MSIIIKINRPDEIIPFSEMIASLPSFRCMKPNNCENFKVGYIDENTIPLLKEVDTHTTEVVSVQDLKELISKLNKYVAYVESHLKDCSLRNVLFTALNTEEGRKVVKDMVHNSEFNPELVEPVYWRKYENIEQLELDK